MNTNRHTSWDRLVAAARRAPATDERDAEVAAPAGFATRVVARAKIRPAAGGLFGGAFDRLATRALGFAGACALAMAVWGSMPATAEARSGEAASAAESYMDPVGEFMELAQSS